MEFYKKILSNKLFQGSQLSNFQLNTFLSQDNRPLPLGELDVAVNEYEQFVKERNESTCYRLSGVLRGLFTNVLFNITEDSILPIMTGRSYQTILTLTGSTGTFNPNFDPNFFINFGYKDILLERDGWFFYRENTAGTLRGCVDRFLRPVPNDFYFLPQPLDGLNMLKLNGVNGPSGFNDLTATRQNWYFKITYPKYTACTSIFFQSPYILGFPGQVSLCEGIVIKKIGSGTLNGRSSTYITTSIKHGLLGGDQIILRPLPSNPTGTVFNVIGVDDDYSFWIDFYDDDIPTNIIGNSTTNNDPLRFKRIFQGIESQYMVRYFQSITDLNDYQNYRAAFADNMFGDPIQLYHYQLDINTDGLRDYLNRPVSELYLTKIKYTNNGTITFNDMEKWTTLSAGLLYDDENRCTNYSVRSIYGGTSSNPLLPPPAIIETIDETKNIFFGDIVDYNEGNLTERILEIPYYRFNTVNREDNFYPEGYYYKAHDKIQLLEFSSQVEQENLYLPDDNIPDYAVSINGVLQWRDLLTPGFTDAGGNGVNYPFLNGCTYVFSEHDLCLFRQNPSALKFCFTITGTTSGSTKTTNLAGSSNYTTLFFKNEAQNSNNNSFSLTIGNTNKNLSDKKTIVFPVTIINSPSISSDKSTYTATLDGNYNFNYSLNFMMTASATTGDNPCAVATYMLTLEHVKKIITSSGIVTGTTLITTYPISSGNISGKIDPTFVGTLTIPMLAGDTVKFVINYSYKQLCNDTVGILSIKMTKGIFSMDNYNGVTVNGTNVNSVNSNNIYNYGLSGINCEDNYGEYLDPIDGDC
jgi:hypothetical protein